jgi:hypothetical protein
MRVLDTPNGPTSEKTGAPTLRLLLQQLHERLSAAKVPVDQMLLPGLAPEVVRARLEPAGLGAPDEVVEWFGWANGWAAPDGAPRSAPPIPDLENSSLEDSLVLYSIVNPRAATDSDFTGATYGVGNGWLPLSHDNWGRFVYCNASAHAAPPVRRANPEPWDPATTSMYHGVSLCTFVAWTIESLDNGGARWLPSEFTWAFDKSKQPRLKLSTAL